VEILYTKGMMEQTALLIVSDGSPGLDKALYSHLYEVLTQRCIFHKIKNLADHLHYGKGRRGWREHGAESSGQKGCK
jgi:transposase-like protein